jgi:hypothetical protein
MTGYCFLKAASFPREMANKEVWTDGTFSRLFAGRAPIGEEIVR